MRGEMADVWAGCCLQGDRGSASGRWGLVVGATEVRRSAGGVSAGLSASGGRGRASWAGRCAVRVKRAERGRWAVREGKEGRGPDLRHWAGLGLVGVLCFFSFSISFSFANSHKLV